jgi:AcrR family transcriptional regulator
MADVATAAGCSRATLYNHFADRRELEVAFVHREAIALSRRVAARTALLVDPAQRIRAAFSATLAGVRDDERLRAWFSTDEVGLATAISANSQVLDAIAAAFAGSLGAEVGAEELRRRARWVLRIVLSLLTMPEADPAEEAAIIERFVVAPLLEQPPGGPAATLR